MHRILSLAAFLLSATTATAAWSQDFSMMSDWAQGQMLNDNLQRNLGTSGNSRRPPVYATGPGIRTPRQPGASVAVPIGHASMSRTYAVPVAPVHAVPGATTSYRASPAVRDRVRAQFVSFIRTSSGDRAAQAIGAEFSRKDYLGLWAAHVAEDGLKPGDVADAMAAYWVENWQMANSVTFTAPAQVRAVRDQVRRTMLAKPAFAQMNDAQKQEMAEIFIYNQIVQDANYTTAMQKGDRATMARLADASVARFKNEMHLDLRRLALTDQGFVARG